MNLAFLWYFASFLLANVSCSCPCSV